MRIQMTTGLSGHAVTLSPGDEVEIGEDSPINAKQATRLVLTGQATLIEGDLDHTAKAEHAERQRAKESAEAERDAAVGTATAGDDADDADDDDADDAGNDDDPSVTREDIEAMTVPELRDYLGDEARPGMNKPELVDLALATIED